MLQERWKRIRVSWPLVYVVDDDESVLRALGRLLRSAHFRVELFASAQEFLNRRCPGGVCLVLDVKMPGMTGLELQQRLASTDPALPVVVISGHRDEGVREQALADGASAFFFKPFEDRMLLDAIQRSMGGGHPDL